MSIKVFIAGDVMPRMGQAKAFKNASEKIFNDVKPYITDADIAVANLEAPVVFDKKTPIRKSGPNLYTSATTVEVLKNVGFNIITLANNHFFDQGQQGVDNTINQCDLLSIHTTGGGKNLYQARKVLLLEHCGQQIALINVCEQEYSIANSEHGGSNPLDLIYMQEDISYARKKADYVVVIVHGGVEHYPYPTPRMKRWYRHFVDLGADVVVNHHQHCMNGYEIYKGKPIFYGLGNFYFPERDGVSKPKSWGYGYAVLLTLDNAITFETIPYQQDVDGIKLRNKNEFEKEIELLNLPIADDYLLQQKFDERIIDNENQIKTHWLPSILRNRVVLALANRGYLGRLYKGNQVIVLKNLLTCESHFESLQRLFTILTK